MRKTVVLILAFFSFAIISYSQRIEKFRTVAKNENIFDLKFGKGNNLFVLRQNSQVQKINVESISESFLFDVKARSMGSSNSTDLVALGTSNGDLHIFREQEQVKTFKAHQGSIAKIMFSQSGLYLATLGLDSTIKIWSTKTFDLIQQINTETDLVADIKISLADDFLVYSTSRGKVVVWNLHENKVTTTHQIGSGYIRNISISPDSTRYAVCGDDKRITILSFRNNDYYQLKKSHRNIISNIQFINSDYLISTSHDNRIVMNNVNIPEDRLELDHFKGYARYQRQFYEFAGDKYMSGLSISDEKKLVGTSFYGKGIALTQHFHQLLDKPHAIKIRKVDNIAVDTVSVTPRYLVKKSSCVIEGVITRPNEIRNVWLYLVKEDKRFKMKVNKKGEFKHQLGLLGHTFDFSIVVEDWDKNMRTMHSDFTLVKGG